MTKTQLNTFWQSNFPKCPPINYLFKIFYNDRWLRIHSLPDSKRYAETAEEWQVLLQTQNSILDDLFSSNDEVILFTGVYSNTTITFAENNFSDNHALKTFNFTALDKIDLYAISKDYCEKDTFFTPYFETIFYHSSTYNELLKSIANDEIRAFFLNPMTKTIVAPYDGGIDIIFSDEATRNLNKTRYKHFTQQDNVNNRIC
jgi:hypothetical protein